MNLRYIGIVSWAGLIGLLVALFYAFGAGHFASDSAALLENPWGLATVLDVYVGIALFSCWIAWREANPGKAAIWILLVALGGNLISTLYVLLALRTSRGEFEAFWHGSRWQSADSNVPTSVGQSEEV